MYNKSITHIPNNTQIYIQDISKKYKINTECQAAAGPAQARGRPGPRGPRLGPGLGRAGCRLVFCRVVYLGYILGYYLVYLWCIVVKTYY